ARERLMRIIDALPTLSSELLSETPQAAALVRSMALRAELAAVAGDSTEAGRWTSVVMTLWKGGDGDTQDVLARLGRAARRN
ncbi:MAG TPA: hypothetical protein VJU15_02410, partial [Gemmatimonadales bacterium]|nr:hypothetical protein [Gemmatimonadales bacterium]